MWRWPQHWSAISTKAHFSDIASDSGGLASIEDANSNYVAQLDAMVAHAKVAYKDLLLAQSGTGDNRPPPPSSAQPDTAAINAAMSTSAEQINVPMKSMRNRPNG